MQRRRTTADSASDRCTARVDAVLTQRPPLRGPHTSGDFFAGLLSDHPQKADPRRSSIAPDPCAILSRSRGGTDGSNPLSSSGESSAN
jgi:hypothetical protein